VLNRVLILDVKQDDNILAQVLLPEQLETLNRIYGDISDFEFVNKVVSEYLPHCIIHLAGLQIPTCKANPILGAKVNVLGTLNIFEASRLLKEHHGWAPGISYASSAAITGSSSDYKDVVKDDDPHLPMTHYGVFKQANEGNARVYWSDHQIPSVGLRPFTVYGVGREFGLTSAPTKALKSLVLGRPYHIPFSGEICLSYVADVALYFIDGARYRAPGALALNIKGDVLTIDEWALKIEELVPHSKGKITFGGNPLPYPAHFSEEGLEKLLGQKPVKTTPVSEAIRETFERFTELHKRGELHDRDLQ